MVVVEQTGLAPLVSQKAPEAHPLCVVQRVSEHVVAHVVRSWQAKLFGHAAAAPAVQLPEPSHVDAVIWFVIRSHVAPHAVPLAVSAQLPAEHFPVSPQGGLGAHS